MPDSVVTAAERTSTLRLILAQIEVQLELQERQRDTVTQKAIALLAAALSFTTVATLPMPFEPPDDPTLSGYFVASWVLYALSCVALLGAAVAAALSLWPRRYARDPAPQALADRYHAEPEADVLAQLVSNLAACHSRNVPAIRRQLFQLKLSLTCLMIGLALILALMLVRGPVAPGVV